MKAKEIVLNWVQTQYKRNRVFYSFDFENEIVNYGRLAHQKVHTPSTYSRTFRSIRSSDAFSRRGIKLIPVKHGESKSKGWKVEKL
jgi:hypothetical protein